MDKDFRYYLVDQDGRSYYVADNGTVVVTSIPQDLNYTPDGWMDKTIAYGRSTKFPGIIRTFTIPLKFTMDGAKILRYLYYNYGIQAVGNLIILKRDVVTNTDVYKQYYIGAIDFSKFSDQNKTVQCNVMEGGLSELIKANEGTKYDIPLSVPEAIPVVMDGVTLYSNVKAINYADIIYDLAFPDGQPDVITSTYIFISQAITDTETKYPSVLWGLNVPYFATEHPEDVPTENWTAQGTEHTTMHLTGKIKFRIAGSAGYRLRGFIKQGTNYDSSRIVELSSFIPSDGFSHDISLDVDVTFTMEQNERLYPFIENSGGGAGKIISFYSDNAFTYVYDYRKAATTVMCLRPLYVLQQLVSKITNGKYTASSSLLSGEAANYVLTCGDALRGFVKGAPVDYNGPVLKTSLNDFIQSYNTKFNIGLGIRDVAIVENKNYFFNNNDLADLGEVANLDLSPATDHLFNTVTIGWPDQNYNDVNGRYEFNTTQGYTTPVTRVVKALDLTSVYRADCYGIEFARINLDNKTTTDSSSDNDVFIININDTLHLNRPLYTSLTGVNTTTVFNVELSPKTCLIAHGDYAHIGLDKLDTGYLSFQTTTKAYNLSRTLNGVTITEKADLQIGTLAAPLFLPHVFQFDTELPLNIVDLIEADPYGKVKFTWDNNNYHGYILECSQQPAMNAKQTFKLLASAENDLTKLI